MAFTVIIPARYGSTRLPGKPLLDIGGKPMLQHVYEQALQSAADRVVVATDDSRIADACTGFGAEAFLTLPGHPSGTDRIEEVSRALALADDAIVVNVQADEPLIPAGVIDQVAGNLDARPEAGIATLSEPVADTAAMFNPNVVKVVSDNKGFALYFSRAPVPWARDEFARGQPQQVGMAVSARRHLGIYAYRAAFLHDFVSWPVAQLEQLECLEQLRAMENGIRIHVEDAVAKVPAGVDTEADLESVRLLLGG